MNDDEIYVNLRTNNQPSRKPTKKNMKKKKKKKTKAGKIIKWILLILLLAILIWAGVFVYKMAKNGWGLQGFLATAVGHDENTLKNMEKIYCLVVGVSGAEENYKLADTIMVVSYDPKIQKASILSIPRDTYVGPNVEKASSSYKINATYKNGKNIDGFLGYVNQITGLGIKNYLIIDTEALVQLVDAIGGVTFNVPIDMDYDDSTQNLHIHLTAGEQLLNGSQSEQLVRFRHNNDDSTYPASYGIQDFGRTRTQREFITATLKQTLKPENIFKIGEILDIAFKNVNTNMNFDTVKDYIPYAVNFNADNLNTALLPSESVKKNGVWIVTYDKEKTKKLVDELFSDPVITEGEEKEGTNTVSGTTTNSSEIKIELLNGSGTKSYLAKATEALEKLGYKVTKSGTTSSTAKTNIINRTLKSTTIQDKIKEALGTGSVSDGAETSNVDFTIVLGKDYKPVETTTK